MYCSAALYNPLAEHALEKIGCLFFGWETIVYLVVGDQLTDLHRTQESQDKMKIIVETARLILRELEYTDERDLFEMDSDPEVHLFIENNPVKSIDEIRKVIAMLKVQYEENGIARWAVVDKLTNECVGWSGLKYFDQPLNNHQNFYELGYRFKRKHWGKGFATESSAAILDYGFKHLNTDKIFAITDPRNVNSKKVLTKLGFDFQETFDYEGDPTDWFELKKATWGHKKPNR